MIKDKAYLHMLQQVIIFGTGFQNVNLSICQFNTAIY